MHNKYEGLADITITPALQAANQDASPTPEQPQVTDSVDGENGLTSCQNKAGDHSACQYLGNLPKKCQGDLCSDCPPVGYPTDRTRCDECPWHGGGAA